MKPRSFKISIIDSSNLSNRNATFCINPWHFERTEPSFISSEPFGSADHTCAARLRFGSSNSEPDLSAVYVCPFCQRGLEEFWPRKKGNLTLVQAWKEDKKGPPDPEVELTARKGVEGEDPPDDDDDPLAEDPDDPLAAADESELRIDTVYSEIKEEMIESVVEPSEMSTTTNAGAKKRKIGEMEGADSGDPLGEPEKR